jgi:hypothetical protein
MDQWRPLRKTAHAGCRDAMSVNDRLRLRIVDPRFQSIPECVQHFNYDGRVRQACRGAAHWMSY